MPKKTKQPIEEPEPTYEPPADYSEPEEEEEPIRISKKTGKPVRKMSEKQLEALRINREKAAAKKKELSQIRDYETKTEMMKKAKQEKDLKQKERLEASKKNYEEVIDSLDTEEVIVKKPKTEKKIKKKVIKYVEASSSESEEEEVIIRKKQKDKHKTKLTSEPSVPEQVTKQSLKSKLEEEQASSLARLMMPVYF